MVTITTPTNTAEQSDPKQSSEEETTNKPSAEVTETHRIHKDFTVEKKHYLLVLYTIRPQMLKLLEETFHIHRQCEHVNTSQVWALIVMFNNNVTT